MPTIIETVRSENRYRARAWNREVATRYVIETVAGPVEASHFAHFDDECFVKQVIELPISFGCPVGCCYCASGALRGTRALPEADLVHITRMLAETHALTVAEPVRVSFSGIGESSLAAKEVSGAALAISRSWPLASFTFTTVGIRPWFINFVDGLACHLPVHVLQVSLVHCDPDRVAAIMPTSKRYSYSLSEVVRAVDNTVRLKTRFNYVVVEGLNDDAESVYGICRELLPIREKIVIRVSQMNETGPSRGHGLRQVTVGHVESITERLREEGLEAYTFASSNNDNLNCGQLVGSYLNQTGSQK